MALHAKPKPKKEPSKEEKAARRRERARERAFTRSHRRIFERAGFSRLQPVDGINFSYEGLKSELDDIFVFENVVVLAEYTRSGGGNLGVHAKGKAGIHNKILEDPSQFLEYFCSVSEGVQGWLASCPYTMKQLIVKAVYASIDVVEDHHKALFKSSVFMSQAERGYFTALTKAIKHSSRFELFDYLKIDPSKVGFGGVIPTKISSDSYEALILPEEQSHFPAGFRVISFYVDPDALLKRCYVLRRNGWRDGLGLYQRLIIPAKVTAIRAHLKEKKRVFANNIVITLPNASRCCDHNGVSIKQSDISQPTPAIIEIPRRANSVGIVDGQHRVFSYYQDMQPDPDIDKFRMQQNLLATGIIYPANMDDRSREKFEAGLFLEINSTQASASSDIIQAIWVLLDPYRPVAVARVVINRLAETTPLKGRLARTSLDAGLIRTASIVAYGLQPLTKRSGTDSLFHIWNGGKSKVRLQKGKGRESDLTAYIEFCVEVLSEFLNAARVALGDKKWRIAEKSGEGILSVTTINSLIILLRKLIEDETVDDKMVFPDLSKLSTINFKSYKSSQYADLASSMRKLIS